MSDSTTRAKALQGVALWHAFQPKGAEALDFDVLFSPSEFPSEPVQQWETEHADVEAALEAVDGAIEDSQRILNIPEDWDGAGAEDYDPDTLRRATNLARSLCWLSVEEHLRKLEPPDISAADAGSIDLFWKRRDRYLLINIPSDSSAPYTFYGESKDEESISGTSKKLRSELLVWLLTA